MPVPVFLHVKSLISRHGRCRCTSLYPGLVDQQRRRQTVIRVSWSFPKEAIFLQSYLSLMAPAKALLFFKWWLNLHRLTIVVDQEKNDLVLALSSEISYGSCRSLRF